jgi:hypothetical protein
MAHGACEFVFQIDYAMLLMLLLLVFLVLGDLESFSLSRKLASSACRQRQQIRQHPHP